MKPTYRLGGKRGSALVAVILVILVLTIVGLGVAYFAQMEETLTGNERLMRAAFYIAEAGLRKGETVIGALVSQNIGLGTILTCGSCSIGPLAPPGGGYPAVLLKATDPEDLTPAKEFKNIVVPVPGYVVDSGTYFLYVRNNPEDPIGPDDDTDFIINLISVGQVRGAGGHVFTKILEEQIRTGNPGGELGGQKNVNAGSTNSAVKGGGT